MIRRGVATYAIICGWTLARAHARSGDRIEIAAYLGSSDRFDQAVADFAESYADLNEADFELVPVGGGQGARSSGSRMTTIEPAAPSTPAEDSGDPADRTPAFHPATPPMHARVPRWIVTSGLTGWLLLGLAGVAAVILWVMAYTSALVTPFLAAVVLAVLFSPIVDALQRRRVPRLLGATIVLLGLLAFTAVFAWAVARGIIDQAPQIAAQLKSAVDALTTGLTELGISRPSAENATAGRPPPVPRRRRRC